MNLRSKLTELGGSALIALLMSFSLTCTMLGALSVPFSPLNAALMCALAVAVCALVIFNRATAIAAGLCAAGGVIWLAVARVNPFSGVVSAVTAVGQMICGGEAALDAETATLLLFAAALFGAGSFLMARVSGGVYPAILLFAFVMLGRWFLKGDVSPLYLLPGLIALAVLYARAFRESGSVLRALPAALIAALLAVMITPGAPVTWQPLQDCADRVRELFNDYFLFNDPRTVYSVGSDGFQPLGDAMGGPATPNQADIMRVKTNDSLLLRGAVSKTYTGYSWIDESVNSRYLFIDPTRTGKRDATFDLDQLAPIRSCLREVSADITMLSAGTSTLFVPHRLKELSIPLDMATYYNETGEVFLTRGVEPGDHYAVTAYVIDADRDTLAAAVNAAESAVDADFQAVSEEYMNLSASVEADLYWLVTDLTRDCAAPFEKAMAIQDYLSTGGFSYTLEADYPPDGRDFVSWFVLDAKQGYCTYYASAMAVMARLAGIPSRYAEGYRVIDDGTGDILVTGESAHAWAELYFSGVGWIPFDVTPGGGLEDDDSEHTHPEGPDATPTPSPTPTPAPTPTPQSDVLPGQTPTPDPGVQDTPEPQDTPSAEPSTPPDTPPNRRSGLWLMMLLGLLILLLILAIAAWLILNRLRRTDPRRMAAREKDERLKIMIWYRAILQLVCRSGMTPDGGETPEMFAERLVQAGCAPRELIALARMVAQMQYSRGAPDPDAARMGEMVYGALLRTMDRRQRMSWHFERMLHGIGDYRQIP